MKRNFGLTLVLAVVAVTFATGCGSSEQPLTPSSPTGDTQVNDPGTPSTSVTVTPTSSSYARSGTIPAAAASTLSGTTWTQTYIGGNVTIKTLTIRDNEIQVKVDCYFADGTRILSDRSFPFTATLNGNRVYLHHSFLIRAANRGDTCSWTVNVDFLEFSSNTSPATVTAAGGQTVGTFQR